MLRHRRNSDLAEEGLTMTNTFVIIESWSEIDGNAGAADGEISPPANERISERWRLILLGFERNLSLFWT